MRKLLRELIIAGAYFLASLFCSTFGLHYLCTKYENKLHLGIKNEQVHFILFSVCIIFVANITKFMKFSELKLNDNVLEALDAMRFDECTPIQEK